MTTSLVPSSSAAHGITVSQNVARDVAERIAAMHASTRRSRVTAWVGFLGPVLLTATLAAGGSVGGAIMAGYFGILVAPVGLVLHGYRRRALRQADVLDRSRDVAWVSPPDGLVFFSDDGVYIEKRGGFRPYGANTRRFREARYAGGRLTLVGLDSLSGVSYALEVRVPDGWTEHDTTRVQQKLDGYTGG